jgi:hypothetical protein
LARVAAPHRNDLSTNLSVIARWPLTFSLAKMKIVPGRGGACNGQAAAMPALLFIVLLFDVTLLGAAELQHRGYALADQVCLGAIGLCDRPLWLAAAAALIIGLYVAQKSK